MMEQWVAFRAAWLTFWSSEAAPAWVQAVGSIVAILISVGVVVLQHTLAQRANKKAASSELIARRKHATQLLEAIRLCAVTGADIAMGVDVGAHALKCRAFARAHRLSVRELQRATETINLNDVATTRIWIGWTSAVRDMTYLIEAFENLMTWADSFANSSSAAPDPKDLERVKLLYLRLASTCEELIIFFDEQDALTLGLEPANERDLNEIVGSEHGGSRTP